MTDAQKSHDLSDCNRATYPLGGYLVLRSDEAFWIRSETLLEVNGQGHRDLSEGHEMFSLCRLCSWSVLLGR